MKPLMFPERTPEQKWLLDARWMGAYDAIVADARKKRDERGEQYNQVGCMPDYFPTPREALQMIRLKAMRLESGLKAGQDVSDDIVDLVSYTLFLGAMLKIGWWE